MGYLRGLRAELQAALRAGRTPRRSAQCRG